MRLSARKKNKLFQRKVDSLGLKLPFTEQFEIMYSGPTPAFLGFCASNNLSIQLNTNSKVGSIAGLAKNELRGLFYEDGLSLEQRGLIGGLLELDPKKVAEYHNLIEGGEEKGTTKMKRIRQASIHGKLNIETDRAIKEFKNVCPGDSVYFHYLVKLNERKGFYDILFLGTRDEDIREENKTHWGIFGELGKPTQIKEDVVYDAGYRYLSWEDPITSSDLKGLENAIREMPGPVSATLV